MKFSGENEVNFWKVNNDDENQNNNNDSDYENIKNTKEKKKLFKIYRATGDGNCLFYTLSTTTFGSDGYFNEIRNNVYDVTIWKLMILKILMI